MNSTIKRYIVPVIVYAVIIASAYYGLNGNEFAWNFFLFTQWLAVILAPFLFFVTVVSVFGTQLSVLDGKMGDTFKPIPSVMSTGLIVYFDIVCDAACIILLAGKGYFVLAVLVFLQIFFLALTRFYIKTMNEYLEKKFNKMQSEKS